MSQEASREELAERYSSEGVFDQTWFVATAAVNVLLLLSAVALAYGGYGAEAGILGVIVGFIITFSLVVYAGIWWAKRY